jgi:hypothetical protein
VKWLFLIHNKGTKKRHRQIPYTAYSHHQALLADKINQVIPNVLQITYKDITTKEFCDNTTLLKKSDT